ncbi:MAG: hypothetical protein WCH76_04520 [Candidatus Riflemargulisbacteria bacterium]
MKKQIIVLSLTLFVLASVSFASEKKAVEVKAPVAIEKKVEVKASVATKSVVEKIKKSSEKVLAVVTANVKPAKK